MAIERRWLGSCFVLRTGIAWQQLPTTAFGADRQDPTDPRHPWSTRRRLRKVYADRGYDHESHRRLVRARGITPVIARRGTAHGSNLGTLRWVIERSLGWLHQFKRLRTPYERRADIHEAFLSLACSII